MSALTVFYSIAHQALRGWRWREGVGRTYRSLIHPTSWTPEESALPKRAWSNFWRSTKVTQSFMLFTQQIKMSSKWDTKINRMLPFLKVIKSLINNQNVLNHKVLAMRRQGSGWRDMPWQGHRGLYKRWHFWAECWMMSSSSSGGQGRRILDQREECV